jgi:branched-chain amino acid aminotransferase
MNEVCVNNYYILNGQIEPAVNFESSMSYQKLVYEVIRVINAVPLFLNDHLSRLFESFQSLQLKNTFTIEQIEYELSLLIKQNKANEGNIKLSFYVNQNEIKYRYFFIPHSYPTKQLYESGIKVSSFKIERPNPSIKELHKNIKSEIDKILIDKSIYEVILLNNENKITEGSRSNVFFIKGNKIYTAPDSSVLTGITRKYILKCCLNLGFEIIYTCVSYNAINQFEGAFITGTSPKVLAITKFDSVNYTIPNIINFILNEYDNIIKQYILKNQK